MRGFPHGKAPGNSARQSCGAIRALSSKRHGPFVSISGERRFDVLAETSFDGASREAAREAVPVAGRR
jgi:hypothetical protein